MRRLLASGTAVLAAAAGITLVEVTSASAAPNGAAFSSTNTSYAYADGSNAATPMCLNHGNAANNCNIYAAKEYVWLNGGPVGSVLGAGSYFFAVLDPSGHPDPNGSNPGSGNAHLLSEDAVANRVFRVSSGGQVTYAGTHAWNSQAPGASTDAGKIQVLPFSDTSNAGGVYTLAICALPATYQPGDPVPTVAPADCKYDNFKAPAESPVPPPAVIPPYVSKTAAGAYTDTWSWGITKSVDQAAITNSSVAGTFNYSVNVTHDSGTIGKVSVSGLIDVNNFNIDAQGNTQPLTLSGVADQLSTGTTCAVDTTGSATVMVGGAPTQASGLTLSATDNYFPYSCDLGVALPSGSIDNTATAAWDQTNGLGLDPGSAEFTFQSVPFTETKVDDCVNVTDTNVLAGLGTVCEGDASPTTFTYPIQVPAPVGMCATNDNTATFTTSTTGTQGSASKSVTKCTTANLTVTNTASGSLQRRYLWKVTKTANNPYVGTSGSSATFNYTVGVNQTGVKDSAIVSSGTATISNPNTFEDITLTGLTVTGTNGICAFNPAPASMVVAKGGSITATYTCQDSSGAPGTDTVTATWDAATASTSSGTASNGAAVTYAVTPTNKTVTPTDVFNGGAPATLGSLTGGPSSLTGTDTAPWASGTWSYSRTVPAPTTGCATYTNTAYDGVPGDPGASAQVQVCKLISGGHTRGWWQNKNGQGLLKANTANACQTVKNYLPTAFAHGALSYIADAYTQVTPFNSAAYNFDIAQCTTTTSKSYLPAYFTNVFSVGNGSSGGVRQLQTQWLTTVLDTAPGYVNAGAGVPSLNAGQQVVIPTSLQSIFGTHNTIGAVLAYTGKNYASYSGNLGLVNALSGFLDAINNNNVVTY